MHSDKKKDILSGISAVIKSELSNVPGLSGLLAGYDGYKQSQDERNIKKIIAYLVDKVDNLEMLFSDAWFKSEDGQKFTRKVIASAFDAQLEDKQELFVNALINGITSKSITDIEKLKFIDILRHLSFASLSILSDMYKITENPGAHKIGIGSAGLINKDELVNELSPKYSPYLIEASIYEMNGVGLFSPTIGYAKRHDGTFSRTGYHAEGSLVFTEFTKRFVEFIIIRKKAANGQ